MHTMLIDKGVPAELIQRVPATNGLDYLDNSENHFNLHRLKAEISDELGSYPPPFIENDDIGTLTNLAWKWTWYRGLQAIVEQPDIVCWMIDDFVLNITYHELLNHVNALIEISDNNHIPFLVLQLAQNSDAGRYFRAPIDNYPAFQHGFSGNEDYTMIYSSEGARRTLNYADKHATIGYSDPVLVACAMKFEYQDLETGLYGPSSISNAEPIGMVSISSDHLLNTVPSGEGCSEREYSANRILTEARGINRYTIDHVYGAFPQITNFPLYHDPDPRLAVLIRLFSHEHDPDAEAFTHLALWSMRSHIVNSDMSTYKPTPIFHVEETHFRRTKHIFHAAGIPASNIIVYPSSLLETNLDWNVMHYAAAPLVDEQLERFERVIVLDADSFSLKGHSTPSPLIDISLNKLPQDTIQLLRTWSEWEPEKDEYQCWYDRGRLGKENWLQLASHHTGGSLSEIEALMYPSDASTATRPWHNGAYINIPMNWLKANPEFRAFIKEVAGTMGDEEIAMAIWFMKHYFETGERLPERGFQDIVWSDDEQLIFLCWDLDLAWQSKDDGKPCFLHLYTFNNMATLAPNWSSDIGASNHESTQFTQNVRRLIATEWKRRKSSTEKTDESNAEPVVNTSINPKPESTLTDSLTTAILKTGDPPMIDHIQDFPITLNGRTTQISNDIIAICEHTAQQHRTNTEQGYVVQHSQAELIALYEIAARTHDSILLTGDIIQCGLFCGGSAFMMAHAIRDDPTHTRPIIALDSYTKDYSPLRNLFDSAYLEYRDNLWEFRLHEHITLAMSDTVQFLQDFWVSPIRLAFIDSSHHYESTKQELKAVFPYIVDGGWIVLHDYFSEQTPGVRQAVDEFLDTLDTSLFTFYRTDQLFIINVKRATEHSESTATPDSAPSVLEQKPSASHQIQSHNPRPRKLPNRIYK